MGLNLTMWRYGWTWLCLDKGKGTDGRDNCICRRTEARKDGKQKGESRYRDWNARSLDFIPGSVLFHMLLLPQDINRCPGEQSGFHGTKQASWSQHSWASKSLGASGVSFFSKIFFWCGPSLKSFEFVTMLFLFHVLIFWPWDMWDLCSPTRDRTHNSLYWNAKS